MNAFLADMLGFYVFVGVVFVVFSIAVSTYEIVYVYRRDGRWLYSFMEWAGHTATIIAIAVIPVVNLMALCGAMGYFLIEHAPYIVHDMRLRWMMWWKNGS